MGLFDMFKKKEAPATPVVPANIEAPADPDVLCAPVAGRAVKMSDVPESGVLRRGARPWLRRVARG